MFAVWTLRVQSHKNEDIGTPFHINIHVASPFLNSLLSWVALRKQRYVNQSSYIRVVRASVNFDSACFACTRVCRCLPHFPHCCEGAILYKGAPANADRTRKIFVAAIFAHVPDAPDVRVHVADLAE